MVAFKFKALVVAAVGVSSLLKLTLSYIVFFSLFGGGNKFIPSYQTDFLSKLHGTMINYLLPISYGTLVHRKFALLMHPLYYSLS
jgi:hypothetical protein